MHLYRHNQKSCTNSSAAYIIGVGMTCTLGGLIQYHVQFMCSIIACLIYDQANIGGAIAPPAPMVPTPMIYIQGSLCLRIHPPCESKEGQRDQLACS